MNLRMVVYLLGVILLAEALFLLLPLIVAVIYAEDTLPAFVTTIVILVMLGFLLTRNRPQNRSIFAKEGFIVVAASWILMSLFGALPFCFSGAIPSYIDSFFETVSGFTTTGATILTDVEVLPNSLAFWRSFTHWIGGMGVLVFVLAIAPLAGDRSMNLMRAEMPGPTKEKFTPKARHTALILYGIYMALTVAEIIFLLAGGMSFFDAVIHAFSTAGTGGFSNKNLSIAYYDSAYIEGVITVFMILFGINFNVFVLILMRKFAQAFKIEEFRVYLIIIAVSVAIVFFGILPMYDGNGGESLRHSVFQVASIITTTGFATTDYNLWVEPARTVLMILMLIGACAGSTGGGMKVGRILIMVKSAIREIGRLLNPRSVRVIKMDGKPLEAQTIGNAHVFLTIYTLLIFLSTLILSFDGVTFETAFTGVLSTINNVGPVLGEIGPMGNCSGFSVFSKLVMSALMLVGRLEIFPVIMLFSPAVWRRK